MEGAADEPLIAEPCCRRADDEEFRVRGRVAALDDAVTVGREHGAIRPRENGAYRHLATGSRRLRLLQRPPHQSRIIHGGQA